MALTATTPIATAYTLEFIQASLPVGARNILEVGCGTGELAESVGRTGVSVLALDSDESCVAAARARGVDARTKSWPAPLTDSFDTVLFTRSLHHIHDLAGAVETAVKALRPGGRIVVEDFRAEGASERSRRWAAGLIELLGAAGAFRSPDAISRLLDKAGPSDGHGHELHSSDAIERELARHGTVESRPAAYYFRYLEPDLPAEATATLLRYELDLIEAGSIDALGRRFVVEPTA